MQQASFFLNGDSLSKRNLIWHTRPFYRPECCFRQSSKLNCVRQGFRFVGFLALALLLFVPCTALALEYGEQGPYRVVRESFQNSGQTVTVFLPDGESNVPVMFFSHGLGGNLYQYYSALLNHVVSRGVAVVFSPYPSYTSSAQQCDTMWQGFERAASIYDFDLDRVGFFGHSWGGGAIFNMALRAVDNDWGGYAMCVFSMAPGPSFVNNRELQSLTDLNLIMMVFENDTNAPHQIAEDIYENIGIPYEYKAYYFVEGADHSEPSNLSVDDYDRLGIWQPLDALMDYTFKLDRPDNGKAYALDGEGDHYRTIIIKDLSEGNEGNNGGGSSWWFGSSWWSGFGGGWFNFFNPFNR